MTRIETALRAMLRNPDVFHPSIDQRAASALATPTGAALSALVEAAEALRAVDPFGDSACGDDRWWAAYARLVQDLDAFRAATEPQAKWAETGPGSMHDIVMGATEPQP